jgi:phosphoribosylamine--glycine ligase
VDRKGAPIVVKADGLAAGKGVVVAMTADEAHEAIDFMLLDNKLGVSHNAGGARVVIEEFLQGEEASFIVLCDGKNVTALATSQDHKRLLDGDQGPNTGGMGAYSPAPVVTPAVHARAMREIILPTMRGMEKDGIPYTGFLYAGLMIDPKGQRQDAGIQLPHGRPRDPADHDAAEVRPVRRDAGRHLRHARPGRAALGPPHRAGRGDGRGRLPAGPAQGRRDHRPAARCRRRHGVPRRHRARTASWSPPAAACCASPRWPTRVKAAQQRAYEVLKGIRFDGAQFRRDIGHRAVKS